MSLRKCHRSTLYPWRVKGTRKCALIEGRERLLADQRASWSATSGLHSTRDLPARWREALINRRITSRRPDGYNETVRALETVSRHIVVRLSLPR